MKEHSFDYFVCLNKSPKSNKKVWKLFRIIQDNKKQNKKKRHNSHHLNDYI